MSIKRTKQRSFGRDAGGDDDESPFFKKAAEPQPTWDDVKDKPEDAFVPYAMTSRFAKGALIQHSKFGRGIVVAVEATSIQVLFEEGTKKLGHGAAA